jgi:hypothetical protein
MTTISMTKTVSQITTIEQAVKVLIDAYGNDAWSEASRRASYARIAGHKDNCRFWEEVLKKLEPVSQAP